MSLPILHPTDDLLLLFGDVRSDADADTLIDEFRNDAAAAVGSDGLPTDASDPFAADALAAAWLHLGSCARCIARRDSLCGEVVAVMVTTPTDQRGVEQAAVHDRVTAALGVFVPNTAATPESLVRAAPQRRRLFARPGTTGSTGSSRGGVSSSNGGLLTRPWAIGVAAVALLASVGAAFALRPRTTEQSAVGTVARAQERSAKEDATATSFATGLAETAVEGDVAAESEAAAETEAAAADAAMAAEAAATPDPVETAPAPPAAAPPSTAPIGETVTGAAAPELSRTEALSPPPPNTRSRASGGASAAPAATAQPPLPKAKTAPTAPPAVASASPAAGAADLSQRRSPDLGPFADNEGALDRFAVEFPVTAPVPALAAPSGAQPTTTAFLDSAVAAAAPPSDFADVTLCRSIASEARAVARVGSRTVLIVRRAEASGRVDAVIDASTCAELARRPVRSPIGAVEAPPPTTTTIVRTTVP